MCMFVYICINIFLLFSFVRCLIRGKEIGQLRDIDWREIYFLLYVLLCFLNFEFQKRIIYLENNMLK